MYGREWAARTRAATLAPVVLARSRRWRNRYIRSGVWRKPRMWGRGMAVEGGKVVGREGAGGEVG